MDYATWASGMGAVLGDAAKRIGAFLPTLLGAVALLGAGWLLGRALRAVTIRLVGRLDRLGPSRLVQDALRRSGMERSVADAIGATVFWLVLLLFVTAATETLGLPVLSTWLGGLSQYLPRVLVAGLILVAGMLGGALARSVVGTAAAGAGVVYADAVGRAAQAAIVLVAAVTAVDQLGIDSRFFTLTITAAVGAGAAGVALAFGLGARGAVSNIIASHYLRQSYRVGHRVRLGAVEGTIVEITPTAVVLEGSEGRVLVPARAFDDGVSVLVTRGG